MSLARRKPKQRSRRALADLFALLTNQPSGEIVHACCRHVGQRTPSSRGVWQREHWIFADNGVRTIIVETANRFARDLMVQEVGYAMLRSLGVTLVAADSPSSFLDDGPTSNLIRQISVLCLNSTRRG